MGLLVAADDAALRSMARSELLGETTPEIRRAELPAIRSRAAGDYRGIYGRQHTPNYLAAITELFIRAGYDRSAQVENTMRWLLSMRQDDGGWVIPARTLGMPLEYRAQSAQGSPQ